MRTACFLLAMAALAIGAPANATPTRIMPLGDSITESSGGHASYRYWLWNDLLSAGYDPDFVGSRYGVHAGEPAFPDFDQDHEGHWGWRADQFRAQIAGWVTTCQPQVILIHLGHNDLWQGQGVANAIADLDAIIDTIRSVRPTAVFLLAQVIPAVDGIGLFQIPLLNDEIAALAARKHTEASPVLVVDQFTGFDPDVDTWDGVHPDESGEIKMADRWFEVLQQVLPDPVGVGSDPPAKPGVLAFPNPFRGKVTLRGSIVGGSGARIDVVDAAGRHRAALRMDRPGVVWDGCDANGEAVPPGVYFARITTDGTIRVRKLIRLR